MYAIRSYYAVGDEVAKGDPLFTLEAMKMFTTVNAPMAGVVKSIEIEPDATVEAKDSYNFV